jgi:hypothetical protein
MVRRRARDAGIETAIGNHSFRAIGITDYLERGGDINIAKRMAGYSNAKTTELYDRRGDEVSFSEIERVGILSGIGQQAIVNQAAFDIGQMTEQKLRQRSRLKACTGTHIFFKIKPNRTEHHVYEKDNRLNRFGDCVTSSRSLCRRTDGIFEGSNRTASTPAA